MTITPEELSKHIDLMRELGAKDRQNLSCEMREKLPEKL